MLFSHETPEVFRGLPIPLIIGCKEQVGEYLLTLAPNQKHHLPRRPSSSQESLITLPNTTHFFLGISPIDPHQGYIFGRYNPDNDFQLASAKETNHMLISRVQFRILVDEKLEWTLIDESSNGTIVNGIRLLSSREQTSRAEQGEPVAGYHRQIKLLLGHSNAIQVAFGALEFDIYVLGNPADYHHGPTTIPSKTSTTAGQLHGPKSSSDNCSEGALVFTPGQAHKKKGRKTPSGPQNAVVEQFNQLEGNPGSSIFNLA
ncbi:MAG: hypothetical protein ALECFALPRED_004775 [Alectoria fallacina]|uniref:FHA domain-containing protein n=1 Tax=Alectoria fallacina TaxID=1903189 RepID=A0A8H3FXF7_9LECA|nr:MAG: hypothetical protein ALECFALPRED_004775 [Alectoria fallacina]